ncbi:MAG: VOC family protein [Anaerolineae bacterium]|nr:VOC family protein [Anaerolineae bacterium]
MSKRKIVYVEIPATNCDAGVKFLQEMFGWELSIKMDEPVPYATLTTGSESLGCGVPVIGDEYKPGEVIIYFDSDDIAADLKKIEALGGKTVSEIAEVPGYGWMAFFVDPSGNRMALWKSAP